MSDFVLTEREGAILTIRFNRAQKKNALTVAMYEAMSSALDQAVADPSVRVIVFAGSEECFTSGNDLMDFMQNPPTGLDSEVFRFLKRLSTCDKPIIAAVAGPAVGIGTTMLLHCDLAWAATNTRFQLPFVSLGLVPEAASSLLLPLQLGHVRAAELLLLAEPFDAKKAYEFGIINGVVEPGDLFAVVRAKAQRLAALPPAALRASKRLMKHGQQAVTERMIDEGAIFIDRLTSPEAGEAMTAFMERRQPDFSRFE
jgi:enoyl-CoA hydratase/carnithine racemase